MIAFFDASALIYLVEGNAVFAERLGVELSRWAKRHPDAGTGSEPAVVAGMPGQAGKGR